MNYPSRCAGCGEKTNPKERWNEALDGGRVKLVWHYKCRLGLRQRGVSEGAVSSS